MKITELQGIDDFIGCEVSDNFQLWDFSARFTAQHTKMPGNPIGTVIGVFNPIYEGQRARLGFVYDCNNNNKHKPVVNTLIEVNPDHLTRVFDK